MRASAPCEVSARSRISICAMQEDPRLANTGVKLRAIAWTAFQETLRRKVFYLVGFLALFAIAIIGSSATTVRMATDAGETAVVTQVNTGSVSQIFGVWEFAVGFLSLYLGAIALSSEISG